MRGWIVGAVLGLLVGMPVIRLAGQVACFTPQEAAAHVGEYGCVTGVVTSVFWAQQSNGRPTFVDMGSRFTVVIWEEDRAKFQPPPETWRGTMLSVWGVIEIYRGKAEIILRGPAQFAPPPAPVRTAPPVPAPVQAPPPAPAPPAPAPPAPTAMPAPVSTASPLPTPAPSPEPTPPSTPEPTPEPTPTPLPFAPGTPVAQARVIATPVLEGPVDQGPPLERPERGGGPPVMLIAGAAALVVLGVGGSMLAGRRRP